MHFKVDIHLHSDYIVLEYHVNRLTAQKVFTINTTHSLLVLTFTPLKLLFCV